MEMVVLIAIKKRESLEIERTRRKKEYLPNETKPGEYEGVCLNPKDIPPDDLDDVILGKMMEEAMGKQ